MNAIVTTVAPATARKPTRINLRWDLVRKTYSYDHGSWTAENNHRQAVVAHLGHTNFVSARLKAGVFVHIPT